MKYLSIVSLSIILNKIGKTRNDSKHLFKSPSSFLHMNFHFAMPKTIGGKFKIKNYTRKGLQVGLKAYQKAFLRIIIKNSFTSGSIIFPKKILAYIWKISLIILATVILGSAFCLSENIKPNLCIEEHCDEMDLPFSLDFFKVYKSYRKML